MTSTCATSILRPLLFFARTLGVEDITADGDSSMHLFDLVSSSIVFCFSVIEFLKNMALFS